MLLFLPCAAQGQSISQVKIGAQQVGNQPNVELTILGEGFGQSANKVKVELTPPPQNVEVRQVSPREIVVQAQTAQNYRLSRVKVSVQGAGSDAIALPKIDEAEVIAGPTMNSGAAWFGLVVFGSGLGPQGELTLSVFPRQGLASDPKVLSSKDDGTMGVAEFLAESGYEAESIQATVGNNSSEPFVIDLETDPDLEWVELWRSIMDPKAVADNLGKRIAKTYIAIQVTVRNKSKDHEFIIHDLTVDLSEALGAGWEAKQSFRNLLLLRGVA